MEAGCPEQGQSCPASGEDSVPLGPASQSLCLQSQSTRLGGRQNSSKKLFKLENAALKSTQKFRQVTKFRQLSAEMGRSWESQRTTGRCHG